MRSLFPQLAFHERTRFFCAFAAFACVAALGIIARTVGDTLFLGSFPPAALSGMYVVTAVCLAALVFRYPELAARTSIDHLIVRTVTYCIVAGVVLRLALLTRWPGVSVAAYVYGDLMCRIPMLLFWSFAALTFDPRESKRLLGIIGAGGTAACILAGSIVKPFARQFGTENLLWLVVVLLAGFAVSVRVLSRKEHDPSAHASAQGTSSLSGYAYYRSLLKSRQFADLAALAFVASFALILNDFIFKTTARATFKGAELAGFFGTFYTWTSIAALIIQLFFVHLVLQRAGVSFALMMLPATLLVTSAGVVVVGSFEWIVMAKFIEPMLEFTINVTAIQMLYLGIRKQSRTQARSFVDGVSKPVAIAVAGVVTALATRKSVVAVEGLALAVAASCLVWLWLSRRNFANYLSGLMESIGAHRLDLAAEGVRVQDNILEGYLREALRRASDQDVPYLLGLLPALGDLNWDEEHRALLQRESPEIKVAALEHLRVRGTRADVMTILPLVRHHAPEVRLAAIRAAATLSGTEVAPALMPILSDPDMKVRATAAAELMNCSDIEGLMSASVALKSMIGSGDATVRAAAAEALALVRHEGLSRPLGGLLRDGDHLVRAAAAMAASSRRSDDLVLSIVDLLQDPDTARAAGDALVVMGPSVLPRLTEVIERELAVWPPPEWLDRLPAILERIGVEGIPLLERLLDTESVHLRSLAIGSYVLLLRQVPLRPHAAGVRSAAIREAREALEAQSLWRRTRGEPDLEVASDAVREEHDRHMKNVFALLEILVPQVDLDTIRRRLGETRESRSEAIEILDNVLDGELKAEILALFEQSARARTSADRDLLDVLLERRSTIWLTIGAAYAAGRSGSAKYFEKLLALLEHASAVVRETAFDALSRLEPASPALAVASEKLIRDPHAGVRKVARDYVTAVGKRAES